MRIKQLRFSLETIVSTDNTNLEVKPYDKQSERETKSNKTTDN